MSPTTTRSTRSRRRSRPPVRSISLVQAEERFGPTTYTWRRLAKAGVIPYVRRAGKLWLDEDAVERWVAEGREV